MLLKLPIMYTQPSGWIEVRVWVLHDIAYVQKTISNLWPSKNYITWQFTFVVKLILDKGSSSSHADLQLHMSRARYRHTLVGSWSGGWNWHPLTFFYKFSVAISTRWLSWAKSLNKKMWVSKKKNTDDNDKHILSWLIKQYISIIYIDKYENNVYFCIQCNGCPMFDRTSCQEIVRNYNSATHERNMWEVVLSRRETLL